MNAKSKLMKDIITVVVGFIAMYAFVSMGGETFSRTDWFMCFLCSGVFLGWKLVTKYVPAVCSWWGLLFHFLLAVMLGIPALPITLIGDIIALKKEKEAAVEA